MAQSKDLLLLAIGATAFYFLTRPKAPQASAASPAPAVPQASAPEKKPSPAPTYSAPPPRKEPPVPGNSPAVP